MSDVDQDFPDCNDPTAPTITLATSMLFLPGVFGIKNSSLNLAATLFGESASRVVVSVAPDRVDDVLSRAAASGVPARIIGRTGGTALRVEVAGKTAIDVTVEEAERVWSTAIDKHFVRRVA